MFLLFCESVLGLRKISNHMQLLTQLMGHHNKELSKVVYKAQFVYVNLFERMVSEMSKLAQDNKKGERSTKTARSQKAHQRELISDLMVIGALFIICFNCSHVSSDGNPSKSDSARVTP